MNRAAPSGGRKITMSDKRLTYIDNSILDNISRYGDLADTVLSRQLHCPRTLLLTRVQQLMEEGYVSFHSDKYFLSESGKSKWIPLDTGETSFRDAPDKQPVFDWTELYIPEKGWQK